MSLEPSYYNGTVCTFLDLQRSNNQLDGTIHCLTRGETVGLTLDLVAAFISLFAVILIFGYMARNVRHAPLGRRRLIQEPLDLYMISLFVANFLQSLSMVLSVKWVNDGKTEVGAVCTAQGIMQQLGETGVAMSALVIAVHSFVAVWWSKGVSPRALRSAGFVIGLCWAYIVVHIIIGQSVYHAQNYITPTPYWCWLGRPYLVAKITGEYFWFWLCLAISSLVYVSLHLWLCGYITLSTESKWFGFRIHKADQSGRDNDEFRGKRRSFAMLGYPLVYCALILPLSVVRWIGFVEEAKGNRSGISYQATLAVDFVFELSGLFDVLLFLYARPGLLLFSEQDAGAVYEAGRAPSFTSYQMWNGGSDEQGEMRESRRMERRSQGVLLPDDDCAWSVAQSIPESRGS
ncbi:hypothetical protein PLICRDRAFT_693106 [Plicaturopsis crispa FD-325 SS-3]|nr:hypothetical protein PLICRDRAFT_693106 [Plicaturopsis crispa FD-325 SS-3]